MYKALLSSVRNLRHSIFDIGHWTPDIYFPRRFCRDKSMPLATGLRKNAFPRHATLLGALFVSEQTRSKDDLIRDY